IRTNGWRDQNPLPYHLATPLKLKSVMAGAAGFEPTDGEIKTRCLTFGSAQLTGTGACVFTEVTSDMNVNEIVTHAPCKAYVVHGLKQSPLC
ncbi:hypothetical protein ACW7EJ_00610, partial [Acinetobacter soli]